VVCCQIAVGSYEGDALITLDELSDRQRIVGGEQAATRQTEVVKISTIDRICEDCGVDHIHLIKIDTEGLDMEVLKGAARMLEDNAIDLIQVEAGMNSTNQLHVPLREFMEYLEPKGYHLFRIYDQVSERTVSKQSCGGIILRRSNPVFISKKLDLGQIIQ
jgi:hypothetical protein